MAVRATPDEPLRRACASIDAARAAGLAIDIESFFDEATNTVSYVVSDPATGRGAIVDSVLGFDAAAGRIGSSSAETLRAFVERRGIAIDWLLETHIHADHLSAAAYLRSRLGGQTAIGREITTVQTTFGALLASGDGFVPDGSDFDCLLDDGATFRIGSIEAIALHVPGHTPADMAYVVGDAVFTGDTLFMPDYGTARADFPGGDARRLYRSIRRLLSLPDATRLFHCHDYRVPGRDHYAWETTVGVQKAGNVHLRSDDEDAFVAMRTARDATLAVPALIFPSIQVNMRAGKLPAPDANGIRYLRIPLDAL